ncbi:unnamed protein product [Phytophthora fragariaefolia]|uniref:Unnamed protein product n=1 Tax=Phytophthora fragariaefolia TaxID=1490495 RepID=A0A9W6Y5X6_9STRA|nr:unnamed protein product [Phytophthora fragariaefolia]
MATFVTVIKTISQEYVRRAADVPRGRALRIPRDVIQLLNATDIPSDIESDVEEANTADADASSVFVGKSPILEYAFQSGLLVDDNREEASVDSGEEGQVPEGTDKDAELERAVDKHLPRRKIITLACGDTNGVKPSQINTSIELSHNNVEQFLASSS